jgi:hypothetical protein
MRELNDDMILLLPDQLKSEKNKRNAAEENIRALELQLKVLRSKSQA